MSKKNPVYGQGYHNFADENNMSSDPWHERYRYGSHYKHGPLNNEKNYSGVGPRGYKRGDEKILEDVCDALTNAYDVDASNLQVDIENSVVYLSGTVSTRQEKIKAEQIAVDIAGVEDVFNRIQIDFNQKRNGALN